MSEGVISHSRFGYLTNPKLRGILSRLFPVSSLPMKYGIVFILVSIYIPFVIFPAEMPVIAGQAAISVDVDAHEIIFARDIDREMYPASTTKLLTALILDRDREETDVLIYSVKAKAEEAFKLDLPVGTEVKASDAMEALLLFSANDIAYMIAENIGNDIPGFSKLMNDYAANLGLEHSHFLNPNGLPDTGHYTSAYDLSVIARELYQHPWIMETIGKKESTIFAGTTLEMRIKNRNKLTGENGCIGGKTGWTSDAGRCLVAFFEREGRRIAGVVLASEYDPGDKIVFDDMLKLMDYSYALEKSVIIEAGKEVNVIPLHFRLFPFIGPVIRRQIGLRIREQAAVYPAADEARISNTLPSPDIFNLDKNKPAGTLIVKLREREDRYPLFPDTSTIDLLINYFLPFYAVVILVIVIIAVIIIVVVNITKKKPAVKVS